MGRLEDAVAQVSRCREVTGSEDWLGLGGHLARAEAAVAAGEGKLDAALAGFESAVTIFRKYALPWEEADTLHRWGRALLAAGAPDRANQKFGAAIQLYQCHGAGQRWVDRVEADRNAGVGRSALPVTMEPFRRSFAKKVSTGRLPMKVGRRMFASAAGCDSSQCCLLVPAKKSRRSKCSRRFPQAPA